MNHNYANSPQTQGQIVEIEGRYYTLDPTMDRLIPVDLPTVHSDSYESYEEPVLPAQELKKEKRRFSLKAKLAMGSMAAGMIILPPATHVAAEHLSNQAINFFDPRPDKDITQNELVEDIGVSINKMIGDL